MIFNLIVISFAIFLGLCFSDHRLISWSDDIKRKRYIMIMSILLILQSGLRNIAVGADTYAYSIEFEHVKQMSWNFVLNAFGEYYISGSGKDPGYTILQKLVQIFIANYQVFLCLIAVMFFTSFGYFIYKNTSKLSEVIFAFILYSTLFYSFFSITGHRQTIATAVTLLSFEFIKKRKFSAFILLILIASTIHKSCLAFLPFYFFFNIRMSEIIIPTSLFGFIIIMIYRVPVSDFLKSVGGYEQYLIYEGAGTYTFTTILLLIALITWRRFNNVLYENENSRFLINALIMAIMITPLTWVNPSAMRIVQYYSIYLTVLIPKILESFGSSNIKFIRIGYAISVLGLVILFSQSDSNYDYKFFWQQMELGKNYSF